MAILQSCCCWRSVRKGSFACGIYTTLYFTMNAIMSSILLHDELLHFRNQTNEAPPSSFIDHDTLSETSMFFTVTFLSVSCTGILTSLLLLYGLYRDKRFLLIPWISTVLLIIIADVAHSGYMFVEHTLKVNPSTAILFTLDLFIISLNIYAFLCVVSQYQELKAGRGRAADEQNMQNIHYNAQPTATSYLSSRRAITCADAKSPPQSPTRAAPPSPAVEAEEADTMTTNGDGGNGGKSMRKAVKFENATRNGTQILEPWIIDMKPSGLIERGGDLLPLIEPNQRELPHQTPV